MKSLKAQYRDLEMKTIFKLKDLIDKSEYISKHNGYKAIKVNVFDYEELCIIHDRLTFLNKYGNEFSIYSDASLEDLIDIVNHAAQS